MNGKTYTDLVSEFNDAQDLGSLDINNNVDRNGQWLKMSEELAELYDEMQKDDNKVKIAHELADLIYVCFSTASRFEIPIDMVFRLVHDANMTKGPGMDKSCYVLPVIKL